MKNKLLNYFVWKQIGFMLIQLVVIVIFIVLFSYTIVQLVEFFK